MYFFWKVELRHSASKLKLRRISVELYYLFSVEQNKSYLFLRYVIVMIDPKKNDPSVK